MNAPQLSAARAIWRARRDRTRGDKAYALYAFILIAVIVVAPIVRALWILASSPTGVTVLTSLHAPDVVSLLAAALWASGLLVGRKRGPALLPSFLLYALTSGGIRRSVALRPPLLRAAAVIVTVLAGSALLVGTALIVHDHVHYWNVVAFIAAAIATGIVTVVLWLVGQVFPRTAFALAPSLILLAGLGVLMPQLLSSTPWGWVGATYPSTESAVLSLAGTAAFATALAALAPVLLNRLTGTQLSEQAEQWEQITALSSSFDFRAGAAVYETKPRSGRSLRAIAPSRHRWLTFMVRDIVGQVRTPCRSLAALAAAAIAGAMMALSFRPGAPSAFLAGVAGIVIYVATGPLAKGLEHAANAAGDYPLYGISDRHLVFLHVLFPFAAMIAVLPVAAATTALASGTALGLALPGTCALGIFALALRLGNALRGPLPASLLTPVSTPAGDLNLVMQFGWAFSDPVIAILGALAIATFPTAPIPLLLLSIAMAAIILLRWRRRR